MTRFVARVPWFVSTGAFVAASAGLAVGANVLIGPYFERTFLDDADPLAAAGTGAAETPASLATMPPAPSRSPEATNPTQTAPPTGNTAAAVIATGQLRDGAPGHNGSGAVKIIRLETGALLLRFEDFSVTNGPDLFVVLSPDENGYAGGSLNLGRLKATDGNINYDIPPGTELASYRSAVVWCRSFDVTFAVAKLESTDE